MRRNIKIRTESDDMPLNVYYTYLNFASVINVLIKEYKIKYTYLSVFLFLQLNNMVNISSIHPGQFRPYSYPYLRFYYRRIYDISLKSLCESGYIKKVSFGSYSFTELGNSLYFSFVRLMDHKTRKK